MPVDAPTVAIVIALLLHVPPAVVSASVLLPPMHNPLLPVMGATEGSTVTVVVVVQPVPLVKVTGAVPTAMALTEPVVAPIVATAVLPLVQVPLVASDNTVDAPAHIVVLPVMGDTGFTLIVLNAVATPPHASVDVSV